MDRVRTKLLIFLFAASAPAWSAAQDASERAVVTNINYKLSSQQVAQYSTEAMDGSPSATVSLIHYYLDVKRDTRKVKYWALIGAENGSAEAQFWAFTELGSSRDLSEQRRAFFWLKRSADQGYVSAVAIFKQCNSLTARQNDKQRSPCFGPGSE